MDERGYTEVPRSSFDMDVEKIWIVFKRMDAQSEKESRFTAAFFFCLHATITFLLFGFKNCFNKQLFKSLKVQSYLASSFNQSLLHKVHSPTLFIDLYFFSAHTIKNIENTIKDQNVGAPNS